MGLFDTILTQEEEILAMTEQLLSAEDLAELKRFPALWRDYQEALVEADRSGPIYWRYWRPASIRPYRSTIKSNRPSPGSMTSCGSRISTVGRCVSLTSPHFCMNLAQDRRAQIECKRRGNAGNQRRAV